MSINYHFTTDRVGFTGGLGLRIMLCLLLVSPLSVAAQQGSGLEALTAVSNPYEAYYEEFVTSKEDITDRGFLEKVALYDRFDLCQNQLNVFYGVTRDAEISSRVESKEEWFEGIAGRDGLDYPFSAEDADYGPSRIIQLQMTVGYEYRKNPDAGLNAFWAQCQALPVELFLQEYMDLN